MSGSTPNSTILFLMPSSPKPLPSIPEADSEPATPTYFSPPPSPPPYDEQDEERAALIREHLAAAIALVNDPHPHSQQPAFTHEATAAGGGNLASQFHHTFHQHLRQQQHQQLQYHYQLDPELAGSAAAATEFYEAARRRQKAQVAALLLFGLFFLSFVGAFVFSVTMAVRGSRHSAAEWARRRECMLTHGRAPHCHLKNGMLSQYNRW